MAERTFSNASCTAAAMDRGATITSWHPEGAHEALFVSLDANAEAEFHGGIPICTPWFGFGHGVERSPKHGAVRWVDWEFEGAKQQGDATRAVWTLDAAATQHLPSASEFPADLQYRFEAVFGRELTMTLTTTSPTEATRVEHLLHAYFLVNAVGSATITGVTEEPLVVEGYHDEVYPGAYSGEIAIAMPDRTITLRGEGMQDIVVWNPGVEYAEVLDDFRGSDWPRMLCVELGNIRDHAVEIPAGGSVSVTLTIGID